MICMYFSWQCKPTRVLWMCKHLKAACSCLCLFDHGCIFPNEVTTGNMTEQITLLLSKVLANMKTSVVNFFLFMLFIFKQLNPRRERDNECVYQCVCVCAWAQSDIPWLSQLRFWEWLCIIQKYFSNTGRSPLIVISYDIYHKPIGQVCTLGIRVCHNLNCSGSVHIPYPTGQCWLPLTLTSIVHQPNLICLVEYPLT